MGGLPNRRKCFNGAKNWFLGWYSSREISVMLSDLPFRVKLAAITDHGRAKEGEYTLLQLGNQHYLQYSHRDAVNDVSNDAVTITLAEQQGQPQKGTRILKEIDGHTSRFSIPNFEGSGSTVVIEFCSKVRAFNQNLAADHVVLSIFLDGNVQGSRCDEDDEDDEGECGSIPYLVALGLCGK